MNRELVIATACQFLSALEEPVSRRSVQAFLRKNTDTKKALRDIEVAAVVARFKAQTGTTSGTIPEPSTVLKSMVMGTIPAQSAEGAAGAPVFAITGTTSGTTSGTIPEPSTVLVAAKREPLRHNVDAYLEPATVAAPPTPPAHAPTRTELDIITRHDSTSREGMGQESGQVTRQAGQFQEPCQVANQGLKLDSSLVAKEQNVVTRQVYWSDPENSAEIEQPLFIVQMAKPVAKRGKPSEPPMPWVKGVVDNVRGLSDMKLRNLSVADQFALARWFAWKCLYCNRNEPGNKSRANKLGRKLGELCTHVDHGQYTVLDYVKACELKLQISGGTPIQSPWEVVNALGRTA